MRAAIITIGSELTEGRVTDTNTGYLASNLERHGIHIALTLTVPDDPDQIVKAIGFAFDQTLDLLILAGGLGPTHDDLTALSVARALGVDLGLNKVAEAMVSDAVSSKKLKSHHKKQAMLPAGCIPIPPAGTAPGFMVQKGKLLIIALPGVPSEMESMWIDVCSSAPVKGVIQSASVPVSRTLCFFGIGEPAIGEVVELFLADSNSGLDVSICSRHGEVVLKARGLEETKGQIEDLTEALMSAFAEYKYSDGKAIEEVIADLMSQKGATLTVAESCTGGMLGETITSVSGASRFFMGGVIAYDNAIKTSLLDVGQKTLDKEGAVSEQVALQMAAGVRTTLGSDYGIGITGVAGPEGGTRQKPVGLVYISVSSNSSTEAQRFNFRGGREEVRRASVIVALHMLHRRLLGDSAHR